MIINDNIKIGLKQLPSYNNDPERKACTTMLLLIQALSDNAENKTDLACRTIGMIYAMLLHDNISDEQINDKIERYILQTMSRTV